MMLERLDQEIRRQIPGYETLSKQKSDWMKAAAAVVWLFNRRFMEHFGTTMYPKVFVPESWFQNVRLLWTVLAHEFVHLLHTKQKGTWPHRLAYIFPQILAVLSVFGFLGIWLGWGWYFCFAFLLCLAPLPAPFRAAEEVAGYRMTLAVLYWMNGRIEDEDVEFVCNQFTGPGYYFMMPFKGYVRSLIEKECDRIVNNEYDHVYPYSFVRKAIQDVFHTP
jgi:hypothetical protein